MSSIKLGTQKQKLDKTTNSSMMSIKKLQEVVEKNSSNKIKEKACKALAKRAKDLKVQARAVQKAKKQ